MIEPRTYHSRSTRDGLGHHPDGTHPCTADGQPAFEEFTRLDHVLDYILNTPDPAYTDLVAAMAVIKLKDAIWALRSVQAMARERAGTDAALPYWTALYVVTIRLQDEASQRDPFHAMHVKGFRRSLELKGIPAMKAAGRLPADAALPPVREVAGLAPHEERVKEAVTQAAADEMFAQIVNNYDEESF